MKTVHFFKKTAAALVIAAVVLTGCGKDKEPEKPVVKVTGVKLDRDALSVDFPGEAKLTATVEPADATNKEVTWSINPLDVAAIGDNGEVMALKPGTATITVTTKDGGFTASCALTVVATSTVITIEASVEDGNTYNAEIDNVKAMLDMDGGDVVVGSGAYADGGFTIDLPATIDAKYLKALGNFREGVTVSDPQAMTAPEADFIAYKSEAAVGYFVPNNYQHADEKPATRINADYIYVDRDVTITGSGSGPMGGTGGWTSNYTYNCSLKKGWNIVYYTSTENSTDKSQATAYTTGAAPAGLKWYYQPEWNRRSSAKAALPRAAGRKALFGKLK